MSTIILKATDIDEFLSEEDIVSINKANELYSKYGDYCKDYPTIDPKHSQKMIQLYNDVGSYLQEVCKKEPRLNVYSFSMPYETHSVVSHLIAKLRHFRTKTPEFIYYIQRAYEMLFNFAYGSSNESTKTYNFVKTPVDFPFEQYAIHKYPNIDAKINNIVTCVLLRGALLPSMIMNKEIQDFSSRGYIPPFALFKVKRNETKNEDDMEYMLNLDMSYFNPKQLEDKDLVFADPMNASGGSLIAVVNYIKSLGIKPKSISFFNTISALKGNLRLLRAIEGINIYTLWIDPCLNSKAWITPGAGDVGDRINGKDEEEPRNIIQLIANYGHSICDLYKDQIKEIEHTVIGKPSY